MSPDLTSMLLLAPSLPVKAVADAAVFAALNATQSLLTVEAGATRATADLFIYDALVLEQATGQLTSNLTSACFK